MTPSTTTPTRPPSLPETLEAIETGSWTPTRGTLGKLLMLSIAGASDRERLRTIRRFAKLATRREGMVWPLWLDSHPDALEQVDLVWATVTFNLYLRRGPSALRRPA